MEKEMSEPENTLVGETLQKKSREYGFLGKVGIIFAGICILFTLVFGYRAYQDYRVAKNKETIRKMTLFCDFNALNDAEQVKLDGAGTDILKAEVVLSNILDDRYLYWDKRLKDVNIRRDNVIAIRKNADFWNPALQRIFDDVMGKLLDEAVDVSKQCSIWREKRIAFKNREWVHFDPSKTPLKY